MRVSLILYNALLFPIRMDFDMVSLCYLQLRSSNYTILNRSMYQHTIKSPPQEGDQPLMSTGGVRSSRLLGVAQEALLENRPERKDIETSMLIS
jgi:hypothetical protein